MYTIGIDGHGDLYQQIRIQAATLVRRLHESFPRFRIPQFGTDNVLEFSVDENSSELKILSSKVSTPNQGPKMQNDSVHREVISLNSVIETIDRATIRERWGTTPTPVYEQFMRSTIIKHWEPQCLQCFHKLATWLQDFVLERCKKHFYGQFKTPNLHNNVA
jgi:hypothetical protein